MAICCGARRCRAPAQPAIDATCFGTEAAIGTGGGVFSGLVVFNHTDLGLKKHEDDFNRIKELADVIVIDESAPFP